MITREQELQRLLNQECLAEIGESSVLLMMSVYCPDNAGIVLQRTTEVLSLVLKQSVENWPSDEQWASILPDWLLSRFAPEMTEAEVAEWERNWRKASSRQKRCMEREEKWTLSGWVYRFRPDDEEQERNWCWWSAKVVKNYLFQVELEVDDMVVANECLNWLLRASGAVDIMEA